MQQLYAIYKCKFHKGNSRGESAAKAIQTYLIDAGFKKCEILSNELLRNYEAVVAIKCVHY